MSTTKSADEPKSIEQQIEELEHPHRDPDILRELYHSRGLSCSKVARRLDCSDATISNWLAKLGIEARSEDWSTRVEKASHYIDKGGYEQWANRDGNTVTNVAIHQLLACLDHDPHDVFAEGNHVHHSTGHPAANIPGLVEIQSRSEHRLLHERGSFAMTDDGWPVLTKP